jgi:hypothetical protein
LLKVLIEYRPLPFILNLVIQSEKRLNRRMLCVRLVMLGSAIPAYIELRLLIFAALFATPGSVIWFQK